MRSLCSLRRAARKWLPAILLCSAMPLLSACGRLKAILVEPGTVVKTREPIPKLKLWVPNAKGEIIEAVGDVPVGASLMIPPAKVQPER